MLIDQLDASRERRRRRLSRLTLVRLVVLLVAGGAVASGVWWLREETPHSVPVEAVRESPLVEARSMKPLLETTKLMELEAYAVKQGTEIEPARDIRESASVVEPGTMPVWLVADGAKSAELLRQELRDRGARQMGRAVRLAMLNVSELLGMTEEAWTAGGRSIVANENHTSALLLTFYLHYLDHDGNAVGVTNLKKAIAGGMPVARAVREHVLAGRSVAQFEREMGAAFGAAGIELQFTRRGGPVFQP